ncbi:hypothetical protein BaRGS_00036200 [Batillaria attramentaria]|uniref:G-protein coupled receptors family 1 profile domain-containing protein n=1 Tax=Batillaria attramentaria TaxID=370345 RepID=A0ABD0JCJ5_9CAEN
MFAACSVSSQFERGRRNLRVSTDAERREGVNSCSKSEIYVGVIKNNTVYGSSTRPEINMNTSSATADSTVTFDNIPVTTVEMTASAVTQTTEAETPPVTQGMFDFIPWDNPDMLLTRAEQRAISTALMAAGLPVFFCLGGVGNVLTAAVWARQGLRERVNLMLFSLALTDLMYLIVGTLPGIWMIGLSFDPAFLFPALQNPEVKFLIEKTGYIVDPSNNFTYAVPVDTELAPSIRQALPQIIIDIDGIILKPIYVGLVLLCTIITTVKLRQATRVRSMMTSTTVQSGSRSLGETRINTMLMVICFTFLLCTLPDAVLITMSYILPTFTYFGRQHNVFLVIYHFNLLAKHVNASANFFVFFILGSRFRRTLYKMLPCFARLAARAAREDASILASQTRASSRFTVETEYSQDTKNT